MASIFQIPSGPSPEITRYFEEKGLKPSFSWKDVWGQEHAHAFTVAKSAGFDILGDVRDAVADALNKGETFESFKKRLEPILKAKGWWGKALMPDPQTGEIRTVQLGSPRRLKVIYEANVRSARAAGQWERAHRTKKLLPYFIYNLGPSEHHRPLHAAKRGLILPVDDPFWLEWYPPNGWGCKCWLRQITHKEAQKLGGPGVAPPANRKPWYNGRRQILEQIPAGIDPGWQTSPGHARAQGMINRLSERMEKESDSVIQETIAELWSNGTATTWARVQERTVIPVGLSRKLAAQTGAKSPLVGVSSDTIQIKTVRHGHHGASPLKPEFFAQVQRFLDTGENTGQDATGGWRIWERINGLLHRLVIKKSGGGYLYVSTLFQSGMSAWKKDRERS